MIFKLSLSLLLLISVRVSEGGRHEQAHHKTLVRGPAKTRATDFLECDEEEQLVYVPPGDQVTAVSPNWPKNYGRWEHCGWRFWTKWDATLIFFCDLVKLSSGDPLLVYQDLKKGAHKNAYTMSNGTLLFRDGYVNVEFSSSLFNGNAGFKCHVQSKAKETTPALTTTVQPRSELPAGVPEPDDQKPGPQPEEPEVVPENPDLGDGGGRSPGPVQPGPDLPAGGEAEIPEPDDQEPGPQPVGPYQTEEPEVVPENPDLGDGGGRSPSPVQPGPDLPAGGEAEVPEPDDQELGPQPEGPNQTEEPEVVPENPDLGDGGDRSPSPVLECSGVQSGIYVEPGIVVTLVSPGYPDKYPINTECGWGFKTSPGVALEVSCDFFSLNKKDYLLLAHGPRANRHRFWFNDGPQKRRFIKGRLLVRFYSNRYTAGDGFSCTVTAKNS